MKKIAAYAVLACASGLFGINSLAQEKAPAQAQPQAPLIPMEVQAQMPAASLSGQATMRFWGFEVYQARLWVPPAFASANFENSVLALELTYLRDFKGADIARRSIAEMRRQAAFSAEQESAWEARMRNLFPDVKPGERITGLNRPAAGATFWHNGRLLGELNDPAFAKLFFGIWLAPQTSEPALRQALLGTAKPMPTSGTAP